MTPTRHPAPARERLLAAAEELFYARGIASTGVDAVIARAGVATGSLYNNFTGKDALVAAYLEARHRRWREQWEAAVAEQTDPAARVLAIFTAMQRWDRTLGKNRGCADVAAILQLPPGSPGAVVATAHKKHVRHRLRELLTEAHAANPDEVARDIMLVYEGMLSLLAMRLDPDPVGRARRHASALLSAALTSP